MGGRQARLQGIFSGLISAFQDRQFCGYQDSWTNQADTPREPARWTIKIDLRPTASQPQIIGQLEQIARSQPRKQINNLFAAEFGLPHTLLAFLLEHTRIDLRLKAANLSREQIRQLAAAVKNLELQISGSRGYREAMVTAGGIALHEVDPRQMKSKIISNLYFAGEILDLDGDTGGYNLQAAFSTGWLAGSRAALNH
jgi:predicted Rossmann fold flavoprotein